MNVQAKTEDHSQKGVELKERVERERAEKERLREAEIQEGGDGQKAAQKAETDGQREKQEMMDKAKAPTQPNAKDFSRQGEREVYDPVTGQNVIVKDAKLEGAFRFPFRSTES